MDSDGNMMGKPKDDLQENYTVTIIPSQGIQSVSSGSAQGGQSLHSWAYQQAMGAQLGYQIQYVDPYEDAKKKHGEELVKKYREVQRMTVDEFAKSEFYRDLLNEKEKK